MSRLGFKQLDGKYGVQKCITGRSEGLKHLVKSFESFIEYCISICVYL